MTTIHYLAYGSNLHPLRLVDRVPSATLIGTVEMPDRKLTFHKRSKDKSGKCNFYEEEGARMHGAVFALDSREKPELDRFEGLGYGYNEQLVTLQVRDTPYEAFVYVAASTHIDTNLRPYDWYKEYVVLGARYHGFPSEYLAELEQVESIADRDKDRIAREEKVLVTLRGI